MTVLEFQGLDNQQPSPAIRGRFNGHYVGASAPKHGAPARVKIWSGLTGDREQFFVDANRDDPAHSAGVVDGRLLKRFWAKVQVGGPNDCWLWTASTAGKGYGQIMVPGATNRSYAHRLSYEINVGPIPSGMMVLHRCDTPRCVNPGHLFVGTCADNLADMAAKGRHLYGERNAKHKLKEDEVHQIFELFAAGWTRGDIAEKFSVGQATVNRILRGERWRHVYEKRRGK